MKIQIMRAFTIKNGFALELGGLVNTDIIQHFRAQGFHGIVNNQRMEVHCDEIRTLVLAMQSYEPVVLAMTEGEVLLRVFSKGTSSQYEDHNLGSTSKI